MLKHGSVTSSDYHISPFSVFQFNETKHNYFVVNARDSMWGVIISVEKMFWSRQSRFHGDIFLRASFNGGNAVVWSVEFRNSKPRTAGA